MKKIIIFFIALIFPFFSYAAEETINVGLVEGLWFSENLFFEGDTVYLHAAFFNSSKFDISGIIVFYNNGEEFYKKKIEVKGDDLFYIKAPFIAVQGLQNFQGEILEVKKITEDGNEEKVLAKNKTTDLGTTVINVDKDTDNDDIGDKEDSDDDNDGYSDEIEAKENSNPLDKNSTPKTVQEKENNDDNSKEKKEKITNILMGVSKEIVAEGNELREDLKEVVKEKIDSIKSEEKNVVKKNPTTEQTGNENKDSWEKEDENSNSEEKLNEDFGSDGDKEVDYYLFFLKLLYGVLSSDFWSWITFSITFYTIYKILKKIFTRIWRKKNDNY